jgi:hypothetical protein
MMVFDPVAAVPAAQFKNPVVMDDCGLEKVRFSTTVSCFSAPRTFKKVTQNA